MNQVNRFMRNRIKIVDLYLKAKEAIIKEGFAEEVDWQNDIQFSQINESYFLKEAAWVVLSSGMKESVIRKKFPSVSTAFYYWRSSKRIVKNRKKCRMRALMVFRHEQKINAIINIAKKISTYGFDSLKICIRNEGIKFIQTMPYMGPATSYHLAKNIGLDVVKPDRHLLRIAAVTGYADPQHLCEDISISVGDRISVVDLVIWRYATLNPNYIEYFGV